MTPPTTAAALRRSRWLPAVGVGLFVAGWAAAVALSASKLLPGPLDVVRALGELMSHGLLVRYLVASLFRVTWGFLLAAALAIPIGMALGLSRRAEVAWNPLVQVLRPISPLAWIPISILWFGVGDGAAIYLIFVATFFSLLVTVIRAVHDVDPVHRNAGWNFGLPRWRLVRQVIFPAILPQLIVGLRLALGVAWLVVVAAEMIAVSSGLGFLIIDARNAGNRYDLVVAGMVMIGAVGLLLDTLVRRLERLPAVSWGFSA
jgi:NitT/TauT family transport system permease protein